MYLTTENGYVKIDKETDLLYLGELDGVYLKVADEKIFHCLISSCYYIDANIREKITLK